ncbi:MSMEG_0570 family nitrogen starvation response protein [Acidisoma sp.]|uniref:MSMEG_0570 family nitrogen starvation response protein n=1 Tax=Acidisoma sp. TaxID=1872115 RepID=UPI003B00A8B5
MPEMIFDIRWPDDATEACYSPSLVVREHLAVGVAYPLPEFVARCRTALGIASERVEAKYGFPCSRAMAQLARLEARATSFAGTPDPVVHVLAFRE